MSEITTGWVRVEDSIPMLGDYSVIAYFYHGGMDMVHVEDYFKDMAAGHDEQGNQLYTKWYIEKGVTHWYLMPLNPQEEVCQK